MRVLIIAKELGFGLDQLYLLETLWRPVPMNAIPGLVSASDTNRLPHVDLGYVAQIDGRTAIVWSEEEGSVIRAQWVLSVEAGNKITAAKDSPKLSDRCRN